MSARAMIVLVGGMLVLTGCGGGGGGDNAFAVALRSTQLALPFWDGAVSTSNGLVYLLVSEFDQAGTDLNGDLDLADNVVHVLDPATGVITNTGVSGTVMPAGNSPVVLWTVSESSQGSQDFNGDGDIADEVIAIFDVALPVSPTNPLVTPVTVTAGSPILFDGIFAVFLSFEGDDGIDYTGDGDESDFVVRAFNAQTITVTAAGKAFDATSFILGIGNGVAAYASAEADDGPMGTDLNLDGDATDTVLFGLDLATGGDFAVGALPRTVVGTVGVVGTALQPMIVYTVDESSDGPMGINLNGGLGDADTADAIIAIWDVNASMEFLPFGGIAASAGEIAGGADRMAFLGAEADNGIGIDMNSDGDFTDVVPYWVNLASPVTANSTGVATVAGGSFLQICDSSLLFVASEADQGSLGTNFNGASGDMDTDDQVTFRFDLSAPALAPFNTGFATSQVLCFEGENTFFLTASESDQGDLDLNGDGDTSDIVPIYFRIDPVTGAVIQGQEGIDTDGPIAFQFTPTQIRIWANAAEANINGDMNLDGDDDDYSIIVTVINRSDGALRAQEVIYSSDTDGTAFPIVVDSETVVFPFAEGPPGAGINGNPTSGDSDTADTILIYVSL